MLDTMYLLAIVGFMIGPAISSIVFKYVGHDISTPTNSSAVFVCGANHCPSDDVKNETSSETNNAMVRFLSLTAKHFKIKRILNQSIIMIITFGVRFLIN